MQVILVLETRSSAKTDYQYVKTAFDYFYGRAAQLSKVFAKCKSELIKQDKNISEKKKRYSGESIVVVVSDYDRENDVLNAQITKYCKENGYELIWMNLDIEEVFLGFQVSDRLKTKTATEFLRKKDNNLGSNKNLSSEDPLKSHPSSNYLKVFDKYFKRIT